MLSIQENKISMYFKVQTFLNQQSSTLSTAVPALTQKVNEFKELINLIGDTVGLASESNHGYTLQKQQYRVELRNRMLEANGALRSYALNTNNMILAGKAAYNKSSLDAMRDTDQLFMATRLKKITLENLAELDNYGYSAPQAGSFSQAIDSFNEFLQSPAEQRGETKAANQLLISYLEQGDALLEIVDSMMETQRFLLPQLYTQYQADRLIDDNASGQSNPIAVETITSTSVKAITKLAYLANRRFKLINDSDGVIVWGLSTKDNEFTSNFFEISAGASSQRLSSAMATTGDFVLVQNNGDQDAVVTLYEEEL